MSTIAVVPTTDSPSEITYHAIAGNKRASGRTMGEAIDALTPQLDDDNAATLVIVQKPRPDRFFTAEQQQRREELTRQWREAQDAGQGISVRIAN